MKWFRSRTKLGARLALFALAVQFVLSFGHVHPAVAGTLTTPVPAIANAATSTVKASVVNAASATPAIAADQANAPALAASDSTPASGRAPDHHPDDYCAICAVMALAGTVMCAEPPVLLLPQAYEFLYLTTDAEFAHLATGRIAFQPRAPPLS